MPKITAVSSDSAITRATEIQKPICRGEEEEDEVDAGEEGRETADGDDGPEELEKEGSVGTVIRRDSSTGSDLGFLAHDRWTRENRDLTPKTQNGAGGYGSSERGQPR